MKLIRKVRDMICNPLRHHSAIAPHVVPRKGEQHITKQVGTSNAFFACPGTVIPKPMIIGDDKPDLLPSAHQLGGDRQ